MKRSIPTVLFFSSIIIFLAFSGTNSSKPRINHIAMHVLDLKKSADFYMQLIGLDSMKNPIGDGKRVWFSIGEHAQLHLIAGARTGLHDKNDHLCFTVSSVDDFAAKLRQQNIQFENWPGDKDKITLRADGVKQIYFQDPDGYWIEINDDRS